MQRMAKYGVIGSGTVGQILADGLLKHGHEVMRGSRDPDKLAQWRAGAGPHASVGNPGFREHSWNHAFKLLRK
jgi:8-hydroxy-5-deazaflavin:NADPH oxidoreductase